MTAERSRGALRRSATIGASVLLLAGTLVAVSPTPAQAQDCVQGTNASSFLGYARNFALDNTVQKGRGASATLRVQSSSVCTNDGEPGLNSVTAWTMVNEPNLAATNPGYVQSGFRNQEGVGTYSFHQRLRGRVGDTFVDSGQLSPHLIAGNTVKYTQKWVQTGCTLGVATCIESYIAGSLYNRSAFDPLLEWPGNQGTNVWDTGYLGEVHYLQSTMPGSATSRTDFNGMEYFSGLNWYAMPCGILRVVNDEATHWRHAESSCNNRQIWDTRN